MSKNNPIRDIDWRRSYCNRGSFHRIVSGQWVSHRNAVPKRSHPKRSILWIFIGPFDNEDSIFKSPLQSSVVSSSLSHIYLRRFDDVCSRAIIVTIIWSANVVYVSYASIAIWRCHSRELLHDSYIWVILYSSISLAFTSVLYLSVVLSSTYGHLIPFPFYKYLFHDFPFLSGGGGGGVRKKVTNPMMIFCQRPSEGLTN